LDTLEVKKALKALGEEADAEGIDRLTDEQRNALVPYWARGVIGNGGFRYFFQGNHDLTDVARRLRTLGLDPAAEACDQVAAAIFPGGVAPGEEARREAILRQVDWEQSSHKRMSSTSSRGRR
jgi:hypothetical protein